MTIEKNATFILSTFERRVVFRHCMKAIEKHYPRAQVIVCDHSRHKYARSILCKMQLNYKVIDDGYDFGLSKARNLCLDAVSTPYLVLIDDDHIIYKRAFDELFGIIESGEADIVALPLSMKNRTQTVSNRIIIDDVSIRVERDKDPFKPEGVDMVNNNFIAKTDTIRRIRWDERFKVAPEHVDFAIRAKGLGIKSIYVNRDGVRHVNFRTRTYLAMRRRRRIQALLEKYNKQRFHRVNGTIVHRIQEIPLHSQDEID